jgi:GNAT superfamily N-acetyltransferase
VPLAIEHDLTEFDCGEAALNDWLRRRALANEGRYGRTYVVCEDMRVVGFYSVAAGAVARGDVPAALRRNAPDAVPVAILGRLAVDRVFKGRGLGADLLADSLRRMGAVAESLGIAAVLIRAKDDAARRFYLHQAEFLEFPEDSRTLFLPIWALRG